MTVSHSQLRKVSRAARKIKSVVVPVRMTDELRDELRDIAEREERTVGQIARLAFREYIERHGVEAQAELAEAR